MTALNRAVTTAGEIAGITRNVLFDFDMTLVDSSEAVTFGLQKLSGVFSLRKPLKEEIFRTIGLPMDRVMKVLWGECREEWLQYYRQKLSPSERKYLKLLPGAAGLLETLQSMDIACGVVSNRGSLKNLVREFGLESRFRTILVLNDGFPPKPDPLSLLFAMEHLGATKDDTIYVGDSVIDIEASRRAGVFCFAVATGSTGRDALFSSGAFDVFNSCREIEQLFKRQKTERALKRDEG
ncbi:MAG: HAD family hydrolase [Thermovirgaceae bacterium]